MSFAAESLYDVASDEPGAELLAPMRRIDDRNAPFGPCVDPTLADAPASK